MTEKVRRIHPGLQWEIGQRGGARQLVVTASGRAEPRSAAARWLLAAPTQRAGWDFHATRQPDRDALTRCFVMGPADRKLALDQATVTVVEDEQAPRLHVTVRHPQFAEFDEPLSAAYLVLDWALGEEDVQRWIGEVTTAADRADNAVPVAELSATVTSFAQQHPRTYALVTATAQGLPLTAIIQTPLSPVDFPLFDQHIAVTVPYTTMNSGRLNTGVSSERMHAFDEALTDVVGHRGLLVAAVSHDGRRVFHFYTDPYTAVADHVAAWDHRWPEGTVEVQVDHDPGWSAVRHFLA